MNEFQERYKSFGNRKLLKIIEEPENYQPIAVEAAKLELSKREVSEDDIESVKHEVLERKVKIEKRQEQINKVENKAKDIGIEFFETISPIQKEPQTTDRKINLIVIIFGLFALYQIFEEFGMLQLMLTGSFFEWDFSTILYSLPMILLPIGVFLFWKRNKIGWMLLSALWVFNIVNAIGMVFLSLEWGNEEEYINDYSSGDIQIEFHEIENLFPQPNPMVYIFIIVFFGAALWLVSKRDVRSEFQIDIKSALITIVVSILITLSIMGLAIII